MKWARPQATDSGSTADRIGALDGVLLALLFVGSVAYLCLLPHNLGNSDEGLFLYEAKRILNGEVLYRDVFEFVAPAGWYLMAVVFRIFGASVETARLTMAVIHGLTMCVMYLSCRAMNVQRGLSVTTAAAYLAVCPTAWPYVSPHWMSTFVVALLVLVLLCTAATTSAAGAIVPGLLSGVLVTVQQQKGAVMGAGVVVLFAANACLGRSAHPRAGWKFAVQREGFYLGAAAVIVFPVLLVLLLRAGAIAVVKALVLFPLLNYHAAEQTRWGSVVLPTLARWPVSFTFPILLKFSPVLLGIALVQLVWLWVRGRDAEKVARLLVLIVTGAFSIVSILYFPDFVHIAFIAPVFLVLLAVILQDGVSALGRRWRSLGHAGAAIALCGLVACAFHLYRVMVLSHRAFPLSLQTAFGRVDFPNPEEIVLVQRIGDVMRSSVSRELFVYPVYASLYLMTNTNNPTPYQILLPGYNSPDQIATAIRILAEKAVRYVLVCPVFLKPNDPVVAYVVRRYRPVDLGVKNCWLFARVAPG